MNIYRESIQEFRTADWNIRVWREVPLGSRILVRHDNDLSNTVSDLVADKRDIGIIAEGLLAMDLVNAVEVKDRAGNGCVFYRSENVVTLSGNEVAII